MIIKEIDGAVFQNMLVSASNALDQHKEEINRLNVFPVPDGDTGSNMFLTMSAVRDLAPVAEGTPISQVAQTAAKAVMRAARGNSGVILSLFFRGMAQGFAGCDTADSVKLADAFRSGSESAKRAVMKPVEGTILTVMRQCTEMFGDGSGENAASVSIPDSILATLTLIHSAAIESVKHTPDLLPVLKRAKVVDSGGFGFAFVISGMMAALSGEADSASAAGSGARTNAGAQKNEFAPGSQFSPAADFAGSGDYSSDGADFSQFSDDEIQYAFCTECLINRTPAGWDQTAGGETGSSWAPDDEQAIDDLRRFLNRIGNSVVLAADDEIVKVHVHTNDPVAVMHRLLEFGTPQFLKAEDMRRQHHALVTGGAQEGDADPQADEGSDELSGCAVIAVANGDGIRDLFMETGASYVIAGGQSMNPSAGDFLKAIKETKCSQAILLPNNSNIIMAAKQAADLADGVEVHVVPSTTIPQGITALLAYMADLSIDENVAAMIEALSTVTTLSFTRAVRNADVEGLQVKRRQVLGLVDNKLRYAEDTLEDAIIAALPEIKDCEFVTIYYGKGVKRADAENIADLIKSLMTPDTEIVLVYGRQPIYSFLISGE